MVVEQILEAGVRLLLQSYDRVRVQVGCQFGELIQGRVGAVHLSGKAWRTKMELTARELIVAAPDGAQLDYGALLAGQVTLTAVAHGWAEAAFDEADFGHFLNYPQVAASLPCIGGSRLVMMADGISIDGLGGRVSFIVCHLGFRIQAALLVSEDGTLSVRVLSALPEQSGPPLFDAHAYEESLVSFFRSLEVDLAGVRLRFAALRFGQVDGCEVVRIRLSAAIKRIPNPFRDRI